MVIFIRYPQFESYQVWGHRAIGPVVVLLGAASPFKSKIDDPSAGVISIVSFPFGIPVMFRVKRIFISPPASALPSFLVAPEILTPVADPPFLLKFKLKSEASSAPVPPLVLYTPVLKVMYA